MKIEKFTVSRDDSIMEGWPDLIRTSSGRLIVVYNECTAHNNRDHSRITIRKSDDNGYTWSEKVYIGEETFHGNQWNSIRANQLSDGRIILVCDKIEDNEKTPETALYLWESTDDGESWSDAVYTGIHGYCSDKVRELSDGSLLLCISVHNHDTHKTEIMAHKSYDGGKTWSDRIPAAVSEEYTFIEPAVLELSDGTLAAFLREDSKLAYNGFMVKSEDGGKTWGEIEELPLPGMHRPFVGYLKNGRILLSYRKHPGGSGRVYPDLMASVFDENSVKTPAEDKFRIYEMDHDRSNESDQGYSAWVQLEDGKILMVNYIVDDAPKAYIRGYRIELENEDA